MLNIRYGLMTSYLLMMCMYVFMCTRDSENHNYAFSVALPIGILGGGCKAGEGTRGLLLAVYFLTLVVPVSMTPANLLFTT